MRSCNLGELGKRAGRSPAPVGSGSVRNTALVYLLPRCLIGRVRRMRKHGSHHALTPRRTQEGDNALPVRGTPSFIGNR